MSYQYHPSDQLRWWDGQKHYFRSGQSVCQTNDYAAVGTVEGEEVVVLWSIRWRKPSRSLAAAEMLDQYCQRKIREANDAAKNYDDIDYRLLGKENLPGSERFKVIVQSIRKN